DEVLMKRRRERDEALRDISRLCRADPGTQPHFYPKTPPVKNQPSPPPERRRVVVRGQQLKQLENCAHRDDGRLTVKSQLIAIVAAVLVVGCGESQSPEPPTAKASNLNAVPADEIDWGWSTPPTFPNEAYVVLEPMLILTLSGTITYLMSGYPTGMAHTPS
ncbi:MAG: hypothetical protein VCB82_01055, partial [Alphaproteobacteria bacterium]